MASPRSLEINTPEFEIPPFAYDVLSIEQPNGSQSSSQVGMVRRVPVPNGGVTLRFLSSGGKEVQETLFVTRKQPEPPKAPAPQFVAAAPPITLLPDPDQDQPTLVELVTPPAPPKGESLDVSDSADAIISKKE